MISTAVLLAFQSQPNLLGKWSGSFKPGSSTITIQVEIANQQGSLVGTGRSPQMGDETVKLEQLKIEGETLSFGVKEVGLRFVGTYERASDTIIGIITRRTTIPLTLKRGWPDEPRRRTQTPKPPFSYTVEEFNIFQPDQRRLGGVFWSPKQPRESLGVVLLCGAGALDRNCTAFGHKMFEVLGDQIARGGFHCAAFDSRGVGSSTGVYASASLTDLRDDAVAVGNRLRASAKLQRIVYLGHSQGADVTLLASESDPSSAGSVLLAPVALSTEQILKRRDTQLWEKVKALLSLEEDQRQESLNSDRSTDAETIRSLFSERSSVDAMKFDLLNHLGRTPTLAISGGLDLEYFGKDSHEALRKKESVKAEYLPNLNHLLQPAKQGQASNYAENPVTIDPNVLRSVVKFLRERSKSNNRSSSGL